MGETAFAGAGDLGSFRTIYENPRRYWQALRPQPVGTWNAGKAFDVLFSLGQDHRLSMLSALTSEDWSARGDYCRRYRRKPRHRIGYRQNSRSPPLRMFQDSPLVSATHLRV